MGIKATLFKGYAKIWIWSFVVVAVLSIGGMVWNVFMAPVEIAATAVDSGKQMAKGVIRQTLNEDNALMNYRAFHRDFEAAKKHLANYELYDKKVGKFKADYEGVPRGLWPSDDRDQFDFISDTRDNFKLAYNRVVADYNQRAERLDSGIFKGWSLPDRLDLIE